MTIETPREIVYQEPAPYKRPSEGRKPKRKERREREWGGRRKEEDLKSQPTPESVGKDPRAGISVHVPRVDSVETGLESELSLEGEGIRVVVGDDLFG